MFPTFISILDIQSWWEVPSIAHFCSLFRTAFNLLDFDIEDLEEALLTDGTEESSWLQELIVRLLSGCLPNNEISTFNYQMFLRRLFRQKCQEHDRYNPFNTDIDFQLLPLRTKVDILYALCDFRLDADDVLDQLKNLEADSLRVEPLGYDNNNSAYWYFYGTRLYREDFQTKNNKKKSVWQVICFTEDDWFQLNKKFKKSTIKCERQLHRTLSENFLPELPRLFREKERLARKRLLDNQPRRTSSRLKKENTTEKEEIENPKQLSVQEEEKQKKLELEIKRREAYERRNRLKEEQSEDNLSEKSAGRYEMAGAKTKTKKSKGRQRKISNSSTNENIKGAKRKKGNENVKSSSATPTTVGRQTNNSLAAATGQIVIQPVSHPHKKKLKTSQVFRQTDEDLITGMHKILDYVKNHEDAWPFTDPVDEDYAPNYYSVIRKPMDLQRMEERLDAGYYKNFTSFRNDFQLIVDNCRLYNGAENEYTEMVDNLSKVFDRATEKFLDQISSSDDEIAVEFPNRNSDIKDIKKSKMDNKTSTKRKPSLVTKTDKKRDRSLSEESLDRRSDSLDKTKRKKVENKIEKSTNKKTPKSKKDKNEIIKDKKISKINNNNNNNNKHKKDKVNNKSLDRKRGDRSISRSPLRSFSSSPPPSSCPSSPDNRFDFFPKKHKSHNFKDISNKGKEKQKSEKYKELFEKNELEVNLKKEPDKGLLSPKPKDKHNKLRETIEKLKAKSEISNKLNDSEFCFDLDAPKENREKLKRDAKNKNKKDKSNKQNSKKDLEYDDSSTLESLQSDNKKSKKNNTTKNVNNKNAAIEALTIATEQTLKDINKWLDDTPKYPEYGSESNSPSFNNLDEFDTTNKIENNKKPEKPIIKKDTTVNKDVKRRTFNRDPSKFIKRREIQRTIDRLQPGKSKGNLLSNVQSTKQNDELFPLGPLKNKDTKNSLIVKTDDNAPKLSLGSVLDSFGRHKFIDDGKKSEENQDKKEDDENINKAKEENQIKDEKSETVTIFNEQKELTDRVESSVNSTSTSTITATTTTITSTTSTSMMSGATPNLSAWFKAFGAPKVQSSQKKSETKADNSKDNEKSDDTTKVDIRKDDNLGKTPIPELSPNNDSPVACHGQPIARQRKISTGSSVSERSSFSQDMDSPRVGIDERLGGAYPAPYPSPLHRSPSGASPVMVSPRPDVSPKSAPYPPFNGQIRVGFYQDTVSTKSSPDKSCSPRDNPQSPYPSHPEHVYTPNTTQNINYSYPNSPYYSHTPNYSNTNPTPPYSSENIINNSYYDTSKSLTDQYQAKTNQNYGAGSPASNNISSSVQNTSNIIETYRHDDQNKDKINQSAMFPVKKRAYNENDQMNNHRYDGQEYMNRNLQPIDHSNNIQNTRNDQEPMKQYIHQNIPDPKPLSIQTSIDNYNKAHSSNSPQQQQQQQQQTGPISQQPPQQLHDLNGMRNYQNAPPPPPAPPPYSGYGNEPNYPLNVPTPQDLERKYTNMGYGGNEVCFSRGMPQYSRPDLNYSPRPNTNLQQTISNQQLQQSESPLRYTNPNSHIQMNYKNMDIDTNPQHAHSNYTNVSTNNRNELTNRLSQPSGEVSVPRPTYNTHLEMEQMGLRGNLTNLSHIVDRYNNDERMLSGLQPPPPPTSQYYGDKNMGTPHIFNKPIATSSSPLPMFNQPMQSYNQSSPVPTSMYNRQLTELSPVGSNEPLKSPNNGGQVQEKKTKKRKNAKNVQSAPVSESTPPPPPNNQGFQSYAGLKTNPSMEPNAISLKTASVVPGSAFNFGPTPTGLSIGSGLYGDKDSYPNFLDDFRSAPNYYMAAAAAAHHRSTPETIPPPIDKQARVVAHQSSTSTAATATTTVTPSSSSSSSIPTSSSSSTTSQPGPPPPPNYPFIGAPQPRPPSYPLGSPFIPPPPPPSQAQLMDPAGSPLYQHYLQAGVLNQGLLGPPGPYPPGYHPALSMRQPYDSMTRPSWL